MPVGMDIVQLSRQLLRTVADDEVAAIFEDKAYTSINKRT